MKPGRTGLSRIWHATGYSLKGISATWRGEAAFRQEVLLSAVLFIASFWVAANPMQWIVLVAPLLMLLIVELLNSAIESTIDRIGSERHELSGRAKDQGSATVMLALVLVALCWGAVIWSRFHA